MLGSIVIDPDPHIRIWPPPKMVVIPLVPNVVCTDRDAFQVFVLNASIVISAGV